MPEVPLQEAINIIQGDITDLQEDMSLAGTTVGKVAVWTGIAVGLGIIAVIGAYQIDKRLRKIEANNNQKAGQ